ncbi:hypothetical protein [uncultured Oscillibacter sp.]|uniref:hypothetical protein n=1 Tax=uncultured Oscillibacter sp. TaxID=876091 RepID=UPI002804ED16|nr:hypothetical protein [uncultured Oscillibacter sp.]
MEFAARTSIVLMVVFLVFIVGGVLLEIFLARRESKWPGLVLPVLTLLYSLAMACNVAAIGDSFPWGALLGTLVVGNIPTVVLLAIYVACREKQRKRSELDKMEIDDL